MKYTENHGFQVQCLYDTFLTPKENGGAAGA
jgi:hypothetical protein